MTDTNTLDDGIIFSIRAWYQNLTFLEKVGLWSLIGAAATAAVLAMMPAALQAAVGGALMAVGTKLLIPILVAMVGMPGPSAN